MIVWILCWAGIHKWRVCKRAVWPMEHAVMSLDLHACARCGEIRQSDAEQLAYLAPFGPCAARVEAIEQVHKRFRDTKARMQRDLGKVIADGR